MSFRAEGELPGNNMVQSLLIQYPENNMPVKIVPQVETEDQVFDIVMKAKSNGGVITHTMVNSDLRRKMNDLCKEMGVKVVDFMGGLAECLEDLLHIKPLKTPGLYREINYQYFDRIESIEFTLSQDDGMSPQRLHDAEIVLTGVSRAGKTPLSVYLAMYGWKVANIPLVHEFSRQMNCLRLTRTGFLACILGHRSLLPIGKAALFVEQPSK